MRQDRYLVADDRSGLRHLREFSERVDVHCALINAFLELSRPYLLARLENIRRLAEQSELDRVVRRLVDSQGRL
jgi:hypothetical protein